MLLSEALGAFVAQLDADGRSPLTIAQYRRHVGLVIREIGDVDVDAITHERIARFLSSDAARTTRFGFAKKPASTNCLRTSLRSFFGYVHAAGYSRTNPARLVRRARCGTAPPRALSVEEVTRLEAIMSSARGAACERDRVFVRLLLATGIRLGSALALDIEDVDFERGELSLRRTKGDRPTWVCLSAAIRDELCGFLGARSSGALFVSRSGNRLGRRHTQRRVSSWLRAAGVRNGGSAHVLRHSFGQRLLERTGDLALVQRAMTHRSISSTLAYVRAADAQLRRAIG